MRPRATLVLAVFSTLFSVSAVAQDWVAVTSPHFEVYSDAGQKDAVRVARELEIVRRVFQTALPTLEVDPSLPLVVIALEDRDDIPTLFPQLREGGSSVSGVFRSGAFEHQIVVATDGGGPDRYHVVYHEYFHLLSSLAAGHLPPWLTEGLAEVYSNVNVRGDTVEIGDPRRDYLDFLNRERLFPLDVLIAGDVDPHSAGNFEATRFYAQAWALTHYLLLGDSSRSGRALVDDYIARLERGVDTTQAFEQAIGPLEEVSRELFRYIRRDAFYGLRMDTPPVPVAPGAPDNEATSGAEAPFDIRVLTNAEAWAIQAGVLAQGTDPEQARPLVDRALATDPRSARAYESLGIMHVELGHTREADTAFREAIARGSERFVPYYLAAFFAVETRRTSENNTNDKDAGDAHDDAERWLRVAIERRPLFAPAYALLAGLRFEAERTGPEARVLARRAVDLEPTEVHHWIVLGEILLAQYRGEEARAVTTEARTWVRSADGRRRLDVLLARTNSVDAVLARAQVLRAAGALEAAVADYRSAVGLDPRNAEAFNGLGWTLFDLGRLEEALAAHRAAIEIDPDNSDAHHALGVILATQGLLDEAEESFRRAVPSELVEPPG